MSLFRFIAADIILDDKANPDLTIRVLLLSVSNGLRMPSYPTSISASLNGSSLTMTAPLPMLMFLRS